MCRPRYFIFIIDCMQKIILISIVFIIGSCRYLPESVGKANEIIVITSPEDKILIAPLLSDVFSKVIHTPQKEQTFILKYKNPWELGSFKKYGNSLELASSAKSILHKSLGPGRPGRPSRKCQAPKIVKTL